MIPPLVAAGYRAVAMDFIGFGRSDKFAETDAYTYQMHVDTLWSFIEQLALSDVTFVMQDWGGLIGLRVAAEHPERAARLVVMNTGLPAGELGPTPQDESNAPDTPFLRWRRFSRESLDLPVGQLVQGATVSEVPPDVIAAYQAPFPDATYKAGARIWPSLVPVFSDVPGVEGEQTGQRGVQDLGEAGAYPFLGRRPDNARRRQVLPRPHARRRPRAGDHHP